VLRAAENVEVSRGVKHAHYLDLKAGIWTIPRERMKRKDVERGDHLVPIAPTFLAALRDWRRADGELCPAPRDACRNVTIDGVEKSHRRGLNLADPVAA